MKIERRIITTEVRMVEGEDGTRTIRGHGAVFNAMSEDLGGFREIIMPGAFSESLGDDVRGLFNHDPNLILGRTASQTMALVEDEDGLLYEIDPPDTQYARDLQVSIDRGDVSQSSFGFRALEESWRHPTEEEPLPVRVLHRVKLYDTGPVTFPAYPDTSAAVRDMAKLMAEGAPAGEVTGPDTEQERVAGRLANLRRRLLLVEL
ncbi:MAG: HK97 family phage prohead protease [Anaerolineae bacterium]|nr:HK97 family phage prohead protease [Anaerolineae bacterium]